MKLIEIEIAIGLAVAGLVAFYFWRLPAGTFNPASPNNVVNSTVNSVGAAVTGDQYFTLGGWIYDMTHPGTVAARDAFSKPTGTVGDYQVAPSSGASGSW